MNISFFQTYGNRLPLLKVRTEDSHFQKFLNNFDINIVSMHNVSDNVRDYVRQNEIVPNQLIWDLKDLSYGECIHTLINFLKVNKPDRFLFYQDDTFSYEISDNNENFLKDLVFNPNFDLINISYKLEYLKEHKMWDETKEILYKCPAFNLYDITSFDFKKSGLWAFDDSCFICSLEKILEIYDTGYWSFSDIWGAESYLKRKYEQKEIARPITDISFFINYNILGKNTNPENLNRLKNRVKLSPETLEILSNANPHK